MEQKININGVEYTVKGHQDDPGPKGESGTPVRSKVPPLGLMPKFIWEQQRLYELKGALARFLDANYPLPQEFVDEFNELVGKLPEV